MKEIRFETDCPQEGIHLHEELEVLYALTGRVGVTVGGWHFVLEPEGVAVFNPFEPHELNKEPGGHTLSLYVPIGPLKQAGLGRVACCSALHPEKAVYLEFLREKLATLFLEYQNPDGTFSFRLSCLYALLGVLQQGFGGDSHAYSVSEADISWLREVLSYVQDNLGEDLSRQAVAQHFFLSPGYLSRKFQQLTGVVFSEFVRDMRLNKIRQIHKLSLFSQNLDSIRIQQIEVIHIVTHSGKSHIIIALVLIVFCRISNILYRHPQLFLRHPKSFF